MRILGKPEKDLNGEFKELVYKFHINDSRALTNISQSVAVRLLKYDHIADFKSVYLFFKDEKLVVIRLHLDKNNKITPSELRSNYEGVPFRTSFETEDQFWWSPWGGSLMTGEERPPNNPRKYPVSYYQIGFAGSSVVHAMVGNLGGSWGSAGPDLPGKVEIIALISEQLPPTRQPKKALEPKKALQ